MLILLKNTDLKLAEWTRLRSQTFPDKDLSIGAVVQDEAVAGLQGALGERVLFRHHRDGHATAGIRHLRGGRQNNRRTEKRRRSRNSLELPKVKCLFRLQPPAGPPTMKPLF